MSICAKLVTVVEMSPQGVQTTQTEFMVDSELVSPSCQYEILTGSEFATLKASVATANSSSLTVSELFAVPAVPDLQTVFMAGFSVPLTLYLAAWAYGVLLSFINQK